MPPTERARPALILLATGSTGGHVTPALAIGEALDGSGLPVRTVFVGPAHGVAERMVSAAARPFVPLEVHPLRGAGLWRWIRGLLALPAAAVRSVQLLRADRPAVVVGTGAATSGPLVAVAALMGIPTVVFEANIEVGLANSWLRPLIDRAALGWADTAEAFGGRALVTGWPVTRAMRTTTRDTDPSSGRFHVLFLGGSDGAAELDHAVRTSLPQLAKQLPQLSVVHQAAESEVTTLRESYRAAGIDAVVESFFGDLTAHYQRASLVVTRAGAATLSELAAVGLPSILIPFRAAGAHQSHNAAAWQRAGCCRTIRPQDLSGSTLAHAILALADDRAALDDMARAARAQHRPDAAERLAALCVHSIRP